MERQREEQYLKRTLAAAQQQWDILAGRSRDRAQAVQDDQDEMLERVTYDMGGLYSKQGFQDLIELSQAAQPVAEAAAQQQRDDQMLRTLRRLMDTPYFARIDFHFDGEEESEPVYIGRAMLTPPNSIDILVYDWRTPLASVYYRYGVGPASYDAPVGKITGNVTLKRQYEIRHGELIYYFDADVQVMDEFLRELLSKSASGAMKSIVETIQRDQDMVIRDMTSDVLLVQGAAGSGKTSVALHRMAYLMYQGLAGKRLAPHDILILSPNGVFEHYISQVLPELGEHQVQTALFEELFEQLLPGVPLQPRSAWAEEWLGCRDAAQKRHMQAIRQFKGSLAFVTLLERFVDELPQRWIPFADVMYAGQCVAIAAESREKVCHSKRQSPLKMRLKWLEDSVWERVHALRPARFQELLDAAAHRPEHAQEVMPYARALSIAEHAALLPKVWAFTRLDVVTLYQQLFADAEAFQRLGEGLGTAEELEAVRQATVEALAAERLPYDDAAALAYLNHLLEGSAPSPIKQVVLDEAQDADALHMSLLQKLYGKARYTILGDINQTITGASNTTLYDDMCSILSKPSVTRVTLDKSFRCTRQIWDFCQKLLPPGAVGDCFSREGAKPRIWHAENDELLVQTVKTCRDEGCKSVALICKTERDAQALYERLKHKMQLRLVLSTGNLNGEGLFVLPLYVAKGLEFDAVLVVDADAEHYSDAQDQSLLYVACTRALHQLHLFYSGTVSPLLPQEE